MLKSPIWRLTFGIVLVCSGAARAEEASAFASPADLWAGIDPEAEPLEIESLRSWNEGGAAFETLRFTGERHPEGAVRVFAIQGAPREGPRVPGILHVHGGGQTASLEWVRFWAARGYACVSFDFCGELPPRTDVTDWGPIRHGNMVHAAGGFQLLPTPRESSWFHWALVSRRALTLLSRHPRVDTQRLGVFGISVGGTLTWMIAGCDARVKAAAPIYGCGYNYDRGNARWGYPPPSDDLRAFQRVLSAEAHAPYITCPLLFLNATNDFHGLFDRSFEALDSVAGEVRQAFTPRYNHHIEPAQGTDLPRFMDWHLRAGDAFPGSPQISLAIGSSGVPGVQVRPAEPDSVAGVDVYYALGDKRPPARFWRTAAVERDAIGWSAAAPVVDPWDDLRVFANVTYRSGVCISSRMRLAVPAQLGKARGTLAWNSNLDSTPARAGHWYFTNGYTDPSLDKSYLAPGIDANGDPFVAFDLTTLGDPVEIQLSTHIVGDPQFTGPEGAALGLTCEGGFLDPGLKVTAIVDDWGAPPKRYTAEVSAAGLSSGTQDLELPVERFVDGEGRSLASWNGVDKLELSGRAERSRPPRFSRLRWARTAGSN